MCNSYNNSNLYSYVKVFFISGNDRLLIINLYINIVGTMSCYDWLLYNQIAQAIGLV